MLKIGRWTCMFLWLQCCAFASARMENAKTDESSAGAFSARLEAGFLFAGVAGIAYPLFSSTAVYNWSGDDTIEPVNAKIHDYEDLDEWTCLLSNDFMFDLSYLFENNVEIYLGTPFYDNDREGLTAGIARDFEDKSRLDTALFLGSMNVWKDPYLLNVKRRQTYQYTLGVQCQYSQIGGTGLDLLCKVKSFFLEDDEAEERDPRLDREGDAGEVILRHSFHWNSSHSLTPGIGYVRSDINGNGLSCRGNRFEMSYSFENDKNSVYANISFQKNTYDEPHPVFGRKMDEKQLWTGMIVTRFDIFKITDLYYRWGLGYGDFENRINFYDLRAFLCFLNVGYLF